MNQAKMCALLIFPAFPEVLFTHVSEVRSARLFTSLRRRLMGEGLMRESPRFLKAVSAAHSLSSLLMWQMREYLCNFPSQYMDIFTFLVCNGSK